MLKELYQLETKNGHLRVRRRKFVFKPDGSVRTSKLHRYAIAPGQDYSGKSKKVQRACKKLFTAAVIRKYKAEEALRNTDPLAEPQSIPDGEVNQVEVVIMEDDHLAICKCTQITEDGETYYEHFDPIDVAPGVPVANAPKLVNDMLKAAHIPTVVARYKAEQEYEAAEQEQEDTPASRKRLKALKTKRDDKRQAYDDFERE